jgi:hypothetical protein
VTFHAPFRFSSRAKCAKAVKTVTTYTPDLIGFARWFTDAIINVEIPEGCSAMADLEQS